MEGCAGSGVRRPLLARLLRGLAGRAPAERRSRRRLVSSVARLRFSFGLLVFLGVFLPLLLFGHLAEEVWEGGGFGWDQSLLLFFHDHASPALDHVMLVFTRLGGWIAVPVITTLTVVILLRRGRRGDAVFLVLSVGGAMLINVILKQIFERARPSLWVSIAPEDSFSFPSGHAMSSMSLAAALVVIVWSDPLALGCTGARRDLRGWSGCVARLPRRPLPVRHRGGMVWSIRLGDGAPPRPKGDKGARYGLIRPPCAEQLPREICARRLPA